MVDDVATMSGEAFKHTRHRDAIAALWHSNAHHLLLEHNNTVFLADFCNSLTGKITGSRKDLNWSVDPETAMIYVANKILKKGHFMHMIRLGTKTGCIAEKHNNIAFFYTKDDPLFTIDSTKVPTNQDLLETINSPCANYHFIFSKRPIGGTSCIPTTLQFPKDTKESSEATGKASILPEKYGAKYHVYLKRDNSMLALKFCNLPKTYNDRPDTLLWACIPLEKVLGFSSHRQEVLLANLVNLSTIK